MDERATAVKPDTITTEASAVAEKVSLAPEEEWPVKQRQKRLKKNLILLRVCDLWKCTSIDLSLQGIMALSCFVSRCGAAENVGDVSSAVNATAPHDYYWSPV